MVRIFHMKNILNKFKINYMTWFLILFSLLAGYIKYTFIIMMIVVIHELGHIFFFKIFKFEILKIIIYPFGGITYINKRIHERMYKDFLCAIGGIVFQIILWGIFLIMLKTGWIAESTYQIFFRYNLTIMFFNILPIVPLDGSKGINIILNKFFSFRFSYKVSGVISFCTFIFLVMFSTYYKVNNLFIYMFLLWKVIEYLKEYKYVMNKFYLERVMYDHYYNEIINNCDNLNVLRLDKYYYFKKNGKYINEKDYIRNTRYL